MRALFWNCCGGVASKIDTINSIIAKFNPEFFFVSEAEVTQFNKSLAQVKGYNMLTSGTMEVGKSRIICYTQEKVIFSVIGTGKLVEIIGIELPDSIIIGAYRPFKLIEGQTADIANDDFFTVIRSMIESTNKTIYLGGDFNINLKKPNKSKESIQLQDLKDELGLTQLVQKTTWMRIITSANGQKTIRRSLLDHVYTNNPDANVLVDDRWTSDHSLIVLEVDVMIQIRRCKTTRRSWKKFSLMSIQDKVCSNLDDCTVDRLVDSDALNGYLTEVIATSLDALCPQRVIRTARPSDIITDAIERIKKRRKRKMALYNKTQNPGLLETIKKLDAKLKKKINEVRKNLIRQKMQSGNKKSFWDMVNTLQGKNIRSEETILEVDNNMVSDPRRLSNVFADFFEDKVAKLSNCTGPYQWIRREPVELEISEEELTKAVASLKGKMCTGHDGIPLKVVKAVAPSISKVLLKLMRLSTVSIPRTWKKSLIVPLHKSKEKTNVANYRPISNLVSISKIFEKIILNRIERNHPGIEGDAQHGFRKQRSTVTALLEMQHELASNMDRNHHVLMYSIDMSAAFDLLKPDVFHSQTPINSQLLDILLDFMTERTFQVKIKSALSDVKALHVGCVQGSILGPKLFGIYCRALRDHIPHESTLISYADDSYVITHGKTLEEATRATEVSIASHVAFLRKIGMVVNSSKTELLYLHRKKSDEPCAIECEGKTIHAAKSIKALGVIVTDTLDWTDHVDQVIDRTSHTIRRIRFLSKWLTKDELLQLVTSQYFGIVYYASPVWMGSLKATNWRRLNTSHYRAIRSALKDFRKRKKRSELDEESKRATPLEWSKYCIASTVIKLYNRSDTRIGELLRTSAYVNDRLPYKAKFLDTSRMKIGRQSLPSRIGPLFANISFNWIDPLISDDFLRQHLKKEFIKF
jgi:hypothetical protein